jgi:pimeloyl-ACP methyl ester carboxylesterase
MDAERLPAAPEQGVLDGIAYGAWPGVEPALLALHGVSATHLAFLPLVGRLPGRRVVAPDLRGRGRSTQVGPTGIAPHGADAVALAAALGLRRPVLVGHSLGAFCAARAAASAAGAFAGLVLLDGGVFAPWRVPEADLRAGLATSVARLGRTFATLDDYVAYWHASPLALEPTPERIAAYARELVPVHGGFRCAVSEERYFADLASINDDDARNGLHARHGLPVLLVRAAGGLDGRRETAVVPDAVLDPARGSFAELTVVDLPAANHYDMLEGAGADAIAGAIDAFLMRVAPAGA